MRLGTRVWGIGFSLVGPRPDFISWPCDADGAARVCRLPSLAGKTVNDATRIRGARPGPRVDENQRSD
jgi:hypothetical protein